MAPIEDRDTVIMLRDKQLVEQNSIIIESARQLKASGLDVEQIAAITKLTIAEIESL